MKVRLFSIEIVMYGIRNYSIQGIWSQYKSGFLIFAANKRRRYRGQLGQMK
jgi:hypothetical protein